MLARLATANVPLAAFDVHRSESVLSNVEWVVGSVDDNMLLSSVVAGCDTVVFLASSSLPASANADVAAEVSSHVRMVVQAAETCSLQGVKRFVFASSGGTVYGPTTKDTLTESDPTWPLNAYGVSKVAIEHYLRVIGSLRGMRTISLRISNPFGPGQSASRGQGFIAAAMSASLEGRELPCWGDGSTVRDFIYIEDVAEAFLRCCSYEGASCVLNIGSGIGRSLRDVIADIEVTTGHAIGVVYSPVRNIDVPRNVLDISRAAAVLSWCPSVPYRTGLQRTAAWWKTLAGGNTE